MKIIELREEDAYNRLDKPYNPPEIGHESEDAFADEWYGVRSKLEALLDRFGENDAYGDKDYTLGETLMLSRGIGVELTSGKMINTQLIPETQSFLSALQQKYEIDFVVATEEGDYHVFVDSSTVRYWCPKVILRRLL